MEVTKINWGHLKGLVYLADVTELLEAVGTESADIIFLDPPFNLGKQYSEEKDIDRRPISDYQDWLISVIDLSISTLKPGGALFLYHLPIWALRIGAHIEKQLSFRHWISVSMKNGFARGRKLYPAHYALLYFTKGTPQYFFRPKLSPLRCRSCGHLVRDYGGYRRIIEKSGINLSDVWDDLSPVRHKTTKYRTANELPMELFNRILTISGDQGMTYVDPFAGSGSGALAAMNHQFNFVVGDLLRENTNIIIERINESIARTGKSYD